jgi:hypothetical protein
MTARMIKPGAPGIRLYLSTARLFLITCRWREGNCRNSLYATIVIVFEFSMIAKKKARREQEENNLPAPPEETLFCMMDKFSALCI